MKILFAASEDAWGGFLNRVTKLLPDHEFIAGGRFEITDLTGIDILIPTMSKVTEDTLLTADRLQLIQQLNNPTPYRLKRTWVWIGWEDRNISVSF